MIPNHPKNKLQKSRDQIANERGHLWVLGSQNFFGRPNTTIIATMEWSDDGIVLGVRRHGESSAIVELLTRAHGRHLGLVRGGASSRMRPLLQPGNSATAGWRAGGAAA